MSDNSVKGWTSQVRRAVLLVLGVAAGVRIAWALVAPAIPILVSLAVVITVLHVAIVGRHRSSK